MTEKQKVRYNNLSASNKNHNDADNKPGIGNNDSKAVTRNGFSGASTLIELHIDDTKRITKPGKGDMPTIHHQLGQGRTRIPLVKIKEHLLSGGTITGAAYKEGGIKGDNWEQQQLFLLDFDTGITIEEFLERCEIINIYPAYVYKTFTHTDEHHRFRAAFVCDTPIFDVRVRNFAQSILRTAFTERNQSGIVFEPDPSCDDLARRFFGTNKGCAYENLNSCFNVIEILDKLLDYKMEKNEKHYSRFVTKFALQNKIELSQRESGPKRLVSFYSYLSDMTSGESMVFPYIYIGFTKNSPPTNPMVQKDIENTNHSGNQDKHSYLIYENIIYQISWIHYSDNKINKNNPNEFNVSSPTYAGNVIDEKNKPRIKDVDKNLLLDKCSLIREFFAGDNRVHHNERLILVTNLMQLNGGIKWYEEGLAKRNDYKIPERILKSAKLHGYKPAGCNQCSYRYSCDHKTNLLQQLPVRQREIRIITNPPVREPLDNTVFKLRDALLSAIHADDTKIHVIKADTGIGKTELLLNSLPEEFAVAFPTHKLKNEAADRFRAISNREVPIWPERPTLPYEYERILQHFYDIRRGGTKKLFEKALGKREVYQNQKWSEAISHYLEALKTVNVQQRTFLTHEKAFQIRHPNLYIFDEDFMNSFIRITTHSLDDIGAIYDLAKIHNDAKHRQIKNHLDSILNVPSNEVTLIPARNYPQETLHNLLVRMPDTFNSPVEVLFAGKAFIKAASNRASRESIHCIEMQKLQANAKYIVLSATANETFYRQLFGDRLEFIDLTGAEMQGRCVVHNNRSYSKTGIIKDEKKFVEKVIEDRSKYGFEKVITHQEFVNVLEKGGIPVAGHFGALEGLDGLGGQNIAIYGTPRIPHFCYKLYAYLLNIDISKDPMDYSWHTIKRGEFEFQMYLCSENPEIHELQLGLIEAALIQAVGRARLVRNDCTVHLFAAMPLPGCVLE